jgi:hypothetical protein
MVERLTSVGAKGHDYRYLLRILEQKPIRCEVPADIHIRLQLVNSWSTTLRYEVFQLESGVAERFLRAAQIIVEWTERS